ncbi:MAG: hypothetical protein U1E15_06230 [Hyphomicrobiales bacterium]
MKKLIIALAAISILAPVPVIAAGKDKAPTAAQRKAAYKRGLEGCRKKYGSSLHSVRVEKYYGKWAVVCYHY